MDLGAIREAMVHLEAAHLLLEPLYRLEHRPFQAVPYLAFTADSATLEAFNHLGALLEIEESRRAAVHVVEMALGDGEGA